MSVGPDFYTTLYIRTIIKQLIKPEQDKYCKISDLTFLQAQLQWLHFIDLLLKAVLISN